MSLFKVVAVVVCAFGTSTEAFLAGLVSVFESSGDFLSDFAGFLSAGGDAGEAAFCGSFTVFTLLAGVVAAAFWAVAFVAGAALLTGSACTGKLKTATMQLIATEK